MSKDTMDYEKVAVALRQNLEVKDRRFRLTKFKQCFIGRDAVDFLLISGLAPTRQVAVEMGRYLQKKIGLFDHVTKDHDFDDEHLFFKFNEDKVLGGGSPDASSGTTELWDGSSEEKKAEDDTLRKTKSVLYGIKAGNTMGAGNELSRFVKKNQMMEQDLESGARREAVLAEAEKTMRQAERVNQINTSILNNSVNTPFESKIRPDEMRCHALVAHNLMKPVMKMFIESHSEILKKFRLTGTNTTMTMCRNVFGEDNEDVSYGPTFTSGPLGGDAQLSALMCLEDLGGLIFFIDPLSAHPHQPDIDSLVRLANVHNVLLCPNPTTAIGMMWMMREGSGPGPIWAQCPKIPGAITTGLMPTGATTKTGGTMWLSAPMAPMVSV